MEQSYSQAEQLDTELLRRHGRRPNAHRADEATVSKHKRSIATGAKLREQRREKARELLDEGQLQLGERIAQARTDGVPMSSIAEWLGLKRQQTHKLMSDFLKHVEDKEPEAAVEQESDDPEDAQGSERQIAMAAGPPTGIRGLPGLRRGIWWRAALLIIWTLLCGFGVIVGAVAGLVGNIAFYLVVYGLGLGIAWALAVGRESGEPRRVARTARKNEQRAAAQVAQERDKGQPPF